MAVNKTRVTRGTSNDTVDDDDKDTVGLGGDVALVGDPGDNSIVAEEGGDEKNWDLPEEQRNQRQPRVNGKVEEADDGEFDEEDSRLAYTEAGDQDDDTPRGQSRRARRNASRRAAQQVVQNDNAALRKQIEDLTGTVRSLVNGHQGLTVNTLDGQLSAMQGQLRVVDEEMANAVKNSDGDIYTRAQRLRDELIGRMYALRSNRERLAAAAADQQDAPGHQNGGAVQQQQVRQQQAPAIDPRVAQYFDRFCDRYDFDPESNDANANIVRAVDQELVGEGYQRNTPLFWQQLERRLAEDYKIRPNQAQRRDEEGGDDDAQDERVARQPMNNQRRQRPPTNSARSASSGRGGGFRLDEMQTNILREEGLLDENLSDDDKAKRTRIIDKWKRGAANARRGVVQ